MRVWSLFHYRSYGAFFLHKIDSIIPTVVLPTTEIIEPKMELPSELTGQDRLAFFLLLLENKEELGKGRALSFCKYGN